MKHSHIVALATAFVLGMVFLAWITPPTYCYVPAPRPVVHLWV